MKQLQLMKSEFDTQPFLNEVFINDFDTLMIFIPSGIGRVDQIMGMGQVFINKTGSREACHNSLVL
jgi:hypothetical protein